MPKVSVVIPCHNDGKYIDEAVVSILEQTYQDFEIIIVNDGSTDQLTNQLLNEYHKPKTRVLFCPQGGPSVARNRGIAEATGEYILPLDADDKIAGTYLEKSVALLDGDSELGIVYCEAEYFGLRQGKWNLPEFSPEAILLDNMIFCSALFRKKDWASVNGYNPNMVYGMEDYDFWLSLLELGVKVFRIPEVLFSYRIKEKSRTVSLREKKHDIDMFVQLFYNHQELYVRNIRLLIEDRYNLAVRMNDLKRLSYVVNMFRKHPFLRRRLTRIILLTGVVGVVLLKLI